ncbi:MAG: glycosyltransferase [Chloroflexi bacterium]|nr:glycosyltransferase [Chloroflexota bacterium]
MSDWISSAVPPVPSNVAPKVSVALITFNHEPHIAQAVESALMQQAHFPYEIIIGDDCSTDRTRAIVVDFQKLHADRIRLLLHEKNLGQIGKLNFMHTLAVCRGQYVALLEGDDYWTSPQKLQRQVEFLDGHPECSTCFHNAWTVSDDGVVQTARFCPADQKPFSTLEDLLRHNFTPTCSVMFRRGLIERFPDWFFRVKMTDWPLNILNAQYGLLGYIDATMAAYRLHQGSAWMTRSLLERSFAELEAFQLLDDYFERRYTDLISAETHRRFFYLAEGYDAASDPANARLYFKKYLASHFRQPTITTRLVFRMFLKLYFPRLFAVMKRGPAAVRSPPGRNA